MSLALTYLRVVVIVFRDKLPAILFESTEEFALLGCHLVAYKCDFISIIQMGFVWRKSIYVLSTFQAWLFCCCCCCFYNHDDYSLELLLTGIHCCWTSQLNRVEVYCESGSWFQRRWQANDLAQLLQRSQDHRACDAVPEPTGVSWLSIVYPTLSSISSIITTRGLGRPQSWLRNWFCEAPLVIVRNLCVKTRSQF